MHFYPLMWARIAGPEGAGRASVYRGRPGSPYWASKGFVGLLLPAVRDGGYAVADQGQPAACLGPVSDGSPPWAVASRPDGLSSLVVGLYGWSQAAVREEAGATAFGPLSTVPYLLSPPRPSAETVHVTLVALTGEVVYPHALASAITASVSGRAVRLRLPGETMEFVL